MILGAGEAASPVEGGAPALPRKLLDPSYYLVDFSFTESCAVFARAADRDFARSLLLCVDSFDAEVLDVVMLEELLAADVPPVSAGINYLFHAPYTGSTLLTRLLERSVQQVRDPVSLYALFATPEPQLPAYVETLRKITLALLARRADRDVLVRAGGSFPQVISPLVRDASFGRALFLYADPPLWAAQILKSADRAMKTRAALAHRGSDYPVSRIAKTPDALSDAEVVALTWVYMAEQVLDAAEVAPGRIATFTFPDLVGESRRAVRRIAEFFGFDAPAMSALEWTGVERVDAKTGASYSAAEREGEIARAGDRHRIEIDATMACVDRLDPNGRLRSGLEALRLVERAH